VQGRYGKGYLAVSAGFLKQELQRGLLSGEATDRLRTQSTIHARQHEESSQEKCHTREKMGDQKNFMIFAGRFHDSSLQTNSSSS
jgi:hypothetical protein